MFGPTTRAPTLMSHGTVTFPSHQEMGAPVHQTCCIRQRLWVAVAPNAVVAGEAAMAMEEAVAAFRPRQRVASDSERRVLFRLRPAGLAERALWNAPPFLL